MNVQSISCVYFSPTETTKTITESIARGIQAESVEMVDSTQPSQRQGDGRTFHNELVILATPVYYGRVPEEVASYFGTFVAEQTPAVLVVVYGNREFEDALKELHDIAVTRGFIPVAGGAFIAEHSYSSATYPIAHGRPDGIDLEKAQKFGAAVREKLARLDSLEDMAGIAVPGQFPYIQPENLMMIKKARETVALTPETDIDMCTQCGQCADVCPTGAIFRDDVTHTDKWRCLICFACVKTCPEGARQMRDPFFNTAIQELHETCQERKEPEIYL